MNGHERREIGKMSVNVVKRDGEVADFNLKKISAAIEKAFEATNKIFDDDIINLLSLRVTADFQAKVKNNSIQGRYSGFS